MAIVIPLPGASPTPIVNPTRRGRYPRGVTNIQSAKNRRGARTVLREEIAKQYQHIQTCKGLIGFAKEAYAKAQITAAQLQQTLERTSR